MKSATIGKSGKHSSEHHDRRTSGKIGIAPAGYISGNTSGKISGNSGNKIGNTFGQHSDHLPSLHLAWLQSAQSPTRRLPPPSSHISGIAGKNSGNRSGKKIGHHSGHDIGNMCGKKIEKKRQQLTYFSGVGVVIWSGWIGRRALRR